MSGAVQIKNNAGLEAGTVTTPWVTTSTPPTGASATQVQGTAANGGALAGNPVQIGISDPAGLVQVPQTAARYAGNGFAATSLLAASPVGLYNSTFSTIPNGNFGNLRMSTQGALAVAASNGTTFESTVTIIGATAAGTGTVAVATAPTSAGPAGIAPNTAAVAATSLIGKNAAGNVYGVNAVCPVAGFVMLLDSATVPTAGGATVTPKKVWAVAAGGSIEVGYYIPLKMAAGAVLVFSTTGPFTYTASSTAFLEMEVV